MRSFTSISSLSPSPHSHTLNSYVRPLVHAVQKQQATSGIYQQTQESPKRNSCVCIAIIGSGKRANVPSSLDLPTFPSLNVTLKRKSYPTLHIKTALRIVEPTGIVHSQQVVAAHKDGEAIRDAVVCR